MPPSLRVTKQAGAKRRGAKSAASPDEEAIRRRAYEIFLERGGVAGDPEADWVEATRQLGATTR